MTPILNLFSKMNKSGLDGNVFGVKWTGSGASLSRLTTSNDPNNYVSVDITNEPDPANSTSPFDNYMPWNGMVEYYSTGGVPAQWTSGNNYISSYHYFVYIPTFYYKIIKSGSTWYYYVSDTANSQAGFTIHPGSNRYIGKYLSGTDSSDEESSENWKIKSKTDMPCFGKSLNDLISDAYNIFQDHKGYLCDVATRFAVMLLYLIEYANWNARSKIGVSATAIITSTGTGSRYTPFYTGATNSITYHTTGSSATRVKYRNIEDIYGVGGEGLSGMYVTQSSGNIRAFVSTSPTRDYTDSSMTLASFIVANTAGYITNFGYDSNRPWLCFIPTTINSSISNTTYNYQKSYNPSTDRYSYYTVEHDPSNNYMINFFSNTFCSTFISNLANYNGRLIYVP